MTLEWRYTLDVELENRVCHEPVQVLQALASG